MLLIKVVEIWHTKSHKYIVNKEQTSNHLTKVCYNVIPSYGFCPENIVKSMSFKMYKVV